MKWGSRANNTGRSIAGPHSKRQEKLNRPPAGEAFTWLTENLIRSAAWRAASMPVRRVIDAVLAAHMDTGGQQNGRLVVTYTQIERFGLCRSSIADAIDAAEVLGLLIVTERGGMSFRDVRKPSLYGLGWMTLCDGTPAANRWNRFESVADARRAVKAKLERVRHGKARKRALREATAAAPLAA